MVRISGWLEGALVLALVGALSACGSSGAAGARDVAAADGAIDAPLEVLPDAAEPGDVAAEGLPDAASGADREEPGPDGEASGPEVEAPDGGTDVAAEPTETGGEDAGGDLPCPPPGAAFDEEDPGLNVLFAVTSFTMMGQGQNMAIGMFLPSAREDFGVTKPYEQPLDTCVVADGSGILPGCATDADCAPEQKCLAEKDNPSNLQCVTPRDPLDVGPFTASGFKSGPRTFTYNAGQSGAYTSTPDGSVPSGEIVFDQVYVAEGGGDPAKGLGAFRAELYVPAQLKVLDPPSSPGQFGTAEIPVNPAEDLTLTWSTGTDGGTLDISLASTSGTGITCHAVNDGTFTIPADMLQKVNLGAQSFFNMLTLTRETPGTVCGEGVTVGVAKFATVVMLNVRKVN